MISITISIFALLISAITLWLAYFHNGKVKMTQPTIVYFGPDGSRRKEFKVYLRTLLFSTSKKGQIVESMYVKVKRKESTQVFNVWVYGEKDLVRGSGLFVGENGIAHNHHFLLPKDGVQFEFLPGEYSVDIYVKLLRCKKAVKLQEVKINLSKDEADRIMKDGYGAYFDWGPESQSYTCHIREGKVVDDYLELFEKLEI